jgi:hypothetical protein
MKIQRLFLDDNKQTEEALKHIYTALIANQDIEISIDLPLQRLKAMGEDSSLSSIEDEDDQSLDLISPRNSAVPPDAMGKLSSSKGKAGEDEAMLNKVEG